MADHKLEPHKITKPIQLLGAWLAGLTAINSTFLIAASQIQSPPWIPALLSIAAVCNVPVFIASLFLLQTKFRPEMQEDSYYSAYLERKYSEELKQPAPEDIEVRLKNVAERIAHEALRGAEGKQDRVLEILKDSELDALRHRFEENRTISELHMHKDGWHEIVESWKGDASFERDLFELREAALIAYHKGDLKGARLTSLGNQLAQILRKDNKLWNQRHERYLRSKKP